MSQPFKISRRKLLTSASSLAVLGALCPASLSFGQTTLPLSLECNQEPAKPLDLLIEKYLESQLNTGGIAFDELIACSVYDLVQQQHLVSLLEDFPLQCASMVKPLVALAFFHKVQYEGMSYGYASQEMMQRMIIQSDNDATNWLMSRVGGPKESEELLRTYYGDIFKNITIVEYIPTSPKREGKTYKNKASAGDYQRLLMELWEDRLPYGRKLLELMALPGAADRIDFGIPDTTVFNKTGSTGHLCGDMGIVTGQNEKGMNYAYTFVMMIESPKYHDADYKTWISQRAEVIRDVSRLVHGEMIKKKHNF